MPVDTSLYANLLRPPKSVAEYDQEAQASKMNALQLQQGQMKMDEYQRGIADQNALRDVYKQFGADEGANVNALYRAGQGEAAQKLQINSANVAKTKAAADKDVLDITTKKRETAIMDIAALQSPEHARASIMDHLAKGDIDQQKAQMLIAGLPQNPADMPKWQLDMINGIMTAKDRVSDVRHVQDKAEQTRQFGITSAETGRHNVVGEQNQAGQLKVAQGHLGISGAQLGLARERLSMDKAAPKGQYDAERGIIIDQRTGQAIPVTMGGAPVGPKGGDAKMTEDQGKATGWLVQAENAFKNMKSATAATPSAASPGLPDIIGALPLADGAANYLRGDDRQKFMQGSSSLSEALLRAATGAGVNRDEAAQKIRELTPVFGDSDAVVKQKMDSIPLYIESLKVRAGPGAKKAAAISTAAAPAGGGFDTSAIAAELKRRGH